MTTLPVMTGAELKAMREYLGLSPLWLAGYLARGDDLGKKWRENMARRIQRMELDQEKIPEELADDMDEIYEQTEKLVATLVANYRPDVEQGTAAPMLATYRSDEEYWRDRDATEFPARWHRMVAQRVADALPGLALVYQAHYRVNRRPWEEARAKRRRQPQRAVSSP
jgi:hypothetical protein